MKKAKNAMKILLTPYYVMKKIVAYIVKTFWAACDYSGKGAEVVKTIPVIIIAILLFYPAWSLPLYLWISLMYGSPVNYILYSLWVGQIIIIGAVVAYIDYIKKRKE
jgi:hypothetical protein